MNARGTSWARCCACLAMALTAAACAEGYGERFMRALLRGMVQYNLGKTPRNLDIIEEATGSR